MQREIFIYFICVLILGALAIFFYQFFFNTHGSVKNNGNCLIENSFRNESVIHLHTLPGTNLKVPIKCEDIEHLMSSINSFSGDFVDYSEIFYQIFQLYISG